MDDTHTLPYHEQAVSIYRRQFYYLLINSLPSIKKTYFRNFGNFMRTKQKLYCVFTVSFVYERINSRREYGIR